MTLYYAVIGNRDHIKIGKGTENMQKRPFWEFLDRQPDGFLSSLAYLPIKDFDLPDAPMIYDCGAWSYKSLDIPKLKGRIVTPLSTLEEYQKYAKSGDLLIAPDHMLIPDTDLDYRRKFNFDSAKEFLSITKDTEFKPMATIHGMDLSERLGYCQRLIDLGYEYFSLGGMAARASQKKKMIETSSRINDLIRSQVPNAWVHVLGLSSPDYFKAFQDIGITSCDGSSHFKQAFTGGTFFTFNGEKLIKHQAVRCDRKTMQPLTPVDLPSCNCLACSRLRTEGIDTRTYGSNENNMGRAAHNLNMLMCAHASGNKRSIDLVSCVGEKAGDAQKAKDLYKSQWFLKARNHVDKGQEWFILSALYGLVHCDEEIQPYEKTLNTECADYRKAWADKVFCCLNELFNPSETSFRIWAGKRYREYLLPLLKDAGYSIEIPLEGLGIGQQLAWFDSQKQAETKKGQLSLF